MCRVKPQDEGITEIRGPPARGGNYPAFKIKRKKKNRGAQISLQNFHSVKFSGLNIVGKKFTFCKSLFLVHQEFGYKFFFYYNIIVVISNKKTLEIIVAFFKHLQNDDYVYGKEGSDYYILEPSGFEIPTGAKLLFGDNEYLHHGRIQKTSSRVSCIFVRTVNW